MSAVNPYTPPRAVVDDVRNEATEFSELKVWSAKGRIGRLRYLAYQSIAYLVLFAASFVFGLIAAAAGSPATSSVAAILLTIPYFVLSILLLIQRSHDMEWSGWSVFLVLIPFVGLIWLFKAGTPGNNKYGAQPPPNTSAIKFFGIVVPIIGAIAIVGILAAVAIPAYQGYVQKAKAMQRQSQQQAQ